MLRYAFLLVALSMIFTACETDVNLTGAYQEKALVYGLIDPLDNPNVGGSGHLFRIQKIFLGDESAFVMALVPDSNYFPYERLLVELVEYNGTTETNRWELDTVMIANKDTGDPTDGTIDFFGPIQRLYRTAIGGSDVVNIDPDRDYKITLKHRPLGLVDMDTVAPFADATTSIINDAFFQWVAPAGNSNVSQKMDLYGTSGEYKDYVVRVKSAERAKQYEVWLRFHYREVLFGVETPKSIEWRVSTFEADGLLGGGITIPVQLSAEAIYSRIGSELTVNADATRKIGKADGAVDDPFPFDGFSQDFDIFVRMAGEDLFEYIDINSPSNTGALQDKPVYTNINNGLGVFSSRTMAEYEGVRLTPSAAQELVDGQYTQGLNLVIEP